MTKYWKKFSSHFLIFLFVMRDLKIWHSFTLSYDRVILCCNRFEFHKISKLIRNVTPGIKLIDKNIHNR